MRTYNQHKPILHSYTSYNIKKPLFVLYNKKEAFYFNASLESLIIDLKKYDNLENIIKFIKNIDNIKDTKQILDCYLTLYKWRALDLKNKYNKLYKI